MADSRFPLGRPVNRPNERIWLPIANRPNWLRNRHTGQEIYVEPVKPKPWPFPIAK